MAEIKQFVGYSLKEESVEALKDHVMDNTFVIEVQHPFANYYGQGMYDPLNPRAILFMTKKRQGIEKVLRSTAKLNEFFDFNLIAGPCKVRIGPKVYYGMRVKGIPTYEDVVKVQHAFTEEGIQMLKAQPLKKTAILIKVHKYFNVEVLEPGIYQDLDDPDMTYISAKSKLNWEQFRAITLFVKNNVSDSTFDIVEGVFFKDGGLEDMFRIVKPKISIELLREIKNKYDSRM